MPETKTVRAAFAADSEVAVVDERLDEIALLKGLDQPTFRGRHAETGEHVRGWTCSPWVGESLLRLLEQDPDLHSIAEVRVWMRG